MDNNQILSLFLKGALGSKGRKRAKKAARFLGANSGFLTASTLLGAAGVAWGIYETMQPSTPPPMPGAMGAMGSVGGPSGPAGGAPEGAVTLPPLPGAAATSPGERGLAPEVLRLVRLAVSAARADGTLLPAERALILSHARATGVESVVEAELAAPRALAEIVGGVTDAQQRRDLYVLAFTMVRADESVSGAERIYLAQLAHQLGLDSAAVAAIEQETAARIDQSSDEPDPPGPLAP